MKSTLFYSHIQKSTERHRGYETCPRPLSTWQKQIKHRKSVSILQKTHLLTFPHTFTDVSFCRKCISRSQPLIQYPSLLLKCQALN